MLTVTPLVGRIPLAKRIVLRAEIYLSYAHVRWLLRNDDATGAMERLRDRHPPTGMVEPWATIAGGRLASQVIRVLEPLPTDSRCLFRSLTLTSVLERRGIRSKLVVAVRPDPFAAHAWVERAGVALLPEGDPDLERLVEL